MHDTEVTAATPSASSPWFRVLMANGALGPGKIALLRQIETFRSVSATARVMRMSHARSVELVAELAELNALGPLPLVDIRTGGEAGGGATLTTAVAIATHDGDLDQPALVAALASPAAYVGVLGAGRRLPDRLAALCDAGVGDTALARLHAPIGLPLGARPPAEVAVAVIGEIIADAHKSSAAASRSLMEPR